MASYLIDTDVMIDVSRGNADAASYLDSLSDAAISIITAQELIVGARDKRDIAGIESLISAYPLMHVDAAIGLLAYDLLKTHAKSDGLRTFDSLIAATAMEWGRVLVSRNRKHFAMIEGLQIDAPRF
jgi:predicted nucleic acid-binding protein